MCIRDRDYNESITAKKQKAEDVVPEIPLSISNKTANENEKLKQEVLEKLEKVLLNLNAVKFKSPSILAQINQFSNLKVQISSDEDKLLVKNLTEIIEKADKILQSQKTKNSEYEIQSQPLIKKGILKYQFTKDDQICLLYTSRCV